MIGVDMDDIDNAIMDAYTCGVGIFKFHLDDGVMNCTRVPIEEFLKFADEIKWRSSQVEKEQSQ